MPAMRSIPIFIALAFIPACAELGDVDGDELDTDSIEAASHTSGVRGTRIDRFHPSTGPEIEVPVDLSATVFEAIAECDGEPQLYVGEGFADGTFRIPGVPPHGRYWLRVGATWIRTDERRIELGIDQLGRPDAVLGTPGTSLVLDVTGLDPFIAGDDIQLQSANAGIGFYSTANAFNPFTAGAPAPGDTALVGAVLPFDADPALGTAAFPLVQASRGDALTIAQLTLRNASATVAYLALTRALTTTTLEMTPGAATAVTGAMTAPPARTTRLDLRPTQWEALADAVDPGAVPVFEGLFVDAAQVGVRILPSGTPDLVEGSMPPGSGDQVVDVAYRDPYPASWRRFTVASMLFQATIAVPGEAGVDTLPVFTNQFAQRRIVGGGAQPMRPLVSPPRAFTVDGHAADDAALATVSDTPVLAWKRPAVGHPSSYRITISRLAAVAPRVTPIAVVRVDGHTHKAELPPGILAAGESYQLTIQARVGDEDDDDQLGGQLELPAGAASAIGPSVTVE
jgi:hypothetical protein